MKLTGFKCDGCGKEYLSNQPGYKMNVVDIEYTGRYGGDTLHETLTVCNTDCFAIAAVKLLKKHSFD